MTYEPDSKIYVVRSPLKFNFNAVHLDAPEKCSCHNSSCFHVLAVNMFTGTPPAPIKQREARLSVLTKSKRAEGKSGRKEPRPKDLDIRVVQAPDSTMAQKRKTSKRKPSTPMQGTASVDADMPPGKKRYDR